jgi:acyl-coenzyme A synthetase/AMP-(fatty) acid ligase
VINQHPQVQPSLVKARASPITGSFVVTGVVPKPRDKDADLLSLGQCNVFEEKIPALCRQTLPAYRVPASIRIVAALAVGASGKLSSA